LSSALAHAAASAALLAARPPHPPPPAPLVVHVNLVAPGRAAMPAAPPAPAPVRAVAAAPAKAPEPAKPKLAPLRPRKAPEPPAPRPPVRAPESAALEPAAPAPGPETSLAAPAAATPGGTGVGAQAGAALAAVAAGPPGGAGGETLADYVARVQRMIDAEKSYPALARRRGIEGVVTVRLAIDAAGALERTALVGRPPELLARSTREAVARAGPFPPPPVGALQIEFPVRYEIVE
jgi:protein TonB